MTNKEAKDFLASEVAQQAALDNVLLSDIERRMLYFTESDETTCEDPFSLNDAFESQVSDTAQYEAKLSRLFDHAHKRLKKSDPAKQKLWEDAIRTLRMGDHYILMMCDSKRSSIASERTSAAGQRVITTGMIGLLLFWISVTLIQDKRVPESVSASVMIVAFLLCLLALFFLVLQGLEAIRRRRRSQN